MKKALPCTRRSFCQVGLAAGGLVVLDGCLPAGGHHGTSDGGAAEDLARPHDGSVSGSHDLAQPPRDFAMPSGKTCPGSQVNAGAASALGTNQARHFTDNATYDIFVCRDSGGVYALDSTCPHAGCSVRSQSGGFFCPCHGASFSFDGENPTPPAFSGLNHLAVCVDGNGTIWVNINDVVDPSTRA